jgi:hypothetical protein
VVATCGPSNPAPIPSKLSSRGAVGRVPCDVCSTAISAVRKAGGGAGGGMGSSGRWSCAEVTAGNDAGGDVPHAMPSQSGVLTCNARSQASGGEKPSFIARRTTSAPAAERLVSIVPGRHLKPSTKRRKETTKPTAEMTTDDGARHINDSPTLGRSARL